jgi:hypothetical protein
MSRAVAIVSGRAPSSPSATVPGRPERGGGVDRHPEPEQRTGGLTAA